MADSLDLAPIEARLKAADEVRPPVTYWELRCRHGLAIATTTKNPPEGWSVNGGRAEGCSDCDDDDAEDYPTDPFVHTWTSRAYSEEKMSKEDVRALLAEVRRLQGAAGGAVVVTAGAAGCWKRPRRYGGASVGPPECLTRARTAGKDPNRLYGASMTTLGEEIQKARERRGLTRGALARRCSEIAPTVRGICEASIKFWEDGDRVPSLAQFDVLADSLALSPADRLLGVSLARHRALTSAPAAQ